ncbi:MAG: flagellar basal body rod protein FlgB [Bacillota bacterium]|nr:flagellar basal body rod protein FlgB [Bacillota bacterium]
MLDKSFSQIDVFKKALNVSWLKNKAISNNISNVDTPGYKKEVVKFESVLNDAIDLVKTDKNHISLNDSGPRIEKVTNTSFRKDDNNVDIDVEMAELSKNQLKFNIITSQLNSKLSRLRKAIDSGR